MRISNGCRQRRAGRLCAAILTIALAGAAGCVPAGYYSDDYLEPEISDYDYLAQYGDWISVPHYGLVWHPWVVEEWSPFYYGHWVWTDDGWAWVSYEPFGMIVYHYGWWDYSLRYGWVWIPDDVWSPARVEWYTWGDYCAWAPLPPPRMSWRDPWDPWDIDVWIVVPVDRFTAEDVGRYRVRERHRDEVVGHGTAVKRPPDARRIESATKEPVTRIPMERERIPIDRDVTKTRSRSGTERTKQPPIRKMVLPDREREKVDEHAPEIERKVLTPKKTEPEKEREKQDRDREREQQERREKEQKTKDKKTDRGRG